MPKFPFATALAGIVPALVSLASPAAAQSADEGRLFVRGYGGVVWSSAENGGDTERDAAFGGGVGVNLTRHFAVIGDVGYITNIATEEGAEALRKTAAIVNFVSGPAADVSLEARTLYFLGGARYTLGSGRFAPFVEGQAGMTRSTLKLKISGADPAVTDRATATFKELLRKSSATDPAIAAGGGTDIRLTDHLAAEALYHYMRLFGDAKANIHQIVGGAKVTF